MPADFETDLLNEKIFSLPYILRNLIGNENTYKRELFVNINVVLL